MSRAASAGRKMPGGWRPVRVSEEERTPTACRSAGGLWISMEAGLHGGDPDMYVKKQARMLLAPVLRADLRVKKARVRTDE